MKLKFIFGLLKMWLVSIRIKSIEMGHSCANVHGIDWIGVWDGMAWIFIFFLHIQAEIG